MFVGMKRVLPTTVFLLGLLASSCLTAEEEFVQDRLLNMCDEAYYICRVTAQCVLDTKHYVESKFPGELRFVVLTKEPNETVRVRILLSTQEAPGTEILLQIYEPNCTLDPAKGREHMEDVDIFEEAGDDKVMIFELTAENEGEHLVEVFSDASSEFLLVID